MSVVFWGSFTFYVHLYGGFSKGGSFRKWESNGWGSNVACIIELCLRMMEFLSESKSMNSGSGFEWDRILPIVQQAVTLGTLVININTIARFSFRNAPKDSQRLELTSKLPSKGSIELPKCFKRRTRGKSHQKSHKGWIQLRGKDTKDSFWLNCLRFSRKTAVKELKIILGHQKL